MDAFYVRAGYTRALKRTLALAGLLVLVQYLPAYYHSWEFNDFVNNEVRRAQSASQLRQSVLDQAQARSLPVTDSDIRITNVGNVYRVDVAYSVPVNLLIYTRHLKFQAMGTGLIR